VVAGPKLPTEPIGFLGLGQTPFRLGFGPDPNYENQPKPMQQPYSYPRSIDIKPHHHRVIVPNRLISGSNLRNIGPAICLITRKLVVHETCICVFVVFSIPSRTQLRIGFFVPQVDGSGCRSQDGIENGERRINRVEGTASFFEM
jgi:hypothetical protein